MITLAAAPTYLGYTALLAQASPNPATADWLTPLLNLGAAGVFMVLILVGRLWTKGSYDELRLDRDAWKQEGAMQRERAEKAEALLARFADEAQITNRLLDEIKAGPRNKPRA